MAQQPTMSVRIQYLIPMYNYPLRIEWAFNPWNSRITHAQLLSVLATAAATVITSTMTHHLLYSHKVCYNGNINITEGAFSIKFLFSQSIRQHLLSTTNNTTQLLNNYRSKINYVIESIKSRALQFQPEVSKTMLMYTHFVAKIPH